MSTKTSPISPNEVQSIKNIQIPNAMIEAANHLIVKNWNGTYANFKTKDLKEEYLSRTEFREIAEKEIYEYNYLDIENLFREVGWKVDFDRPGFNESYDSNFTFSK